jgi:hypothetical protein
MHTTNTTRTRSATATQPEPIRIPGTAFLLRRCRTCGEEKPLRAYYKQRNCAEVYRLDCIPCVAAANKRRRDQERKASTPQRRRCQNCRKRRPMAEFAREARGHEEQVAVCQACLAALRAERRERGEESPLVLPCFSERRRHRIDLGIAIAHATCAPGHCRSLEELAAYSGVTVEAMRRIERRALAKMRKQAKGLLEALGLEDVMKGGMRL